MQRWTHCEEEIIPAKLRLYEYLLKNCLTESSDVSPRGYIPSKRRGLIYTGHSNHFKMIYQSIYTVRQWTGSDSIPLPVEIYVPNRCLSV